MTCPYCGNRICFEEIGDFVFCCRCNSTVPVVVG